jgi:hypothetical protein
MMEAVRTSETSVNTRGATAQKTLNLLLIKAEDLKFEPQPF